MKRARRLEAWLRRLVATYQDRRLKPRDRTYTNLTHMRRPTQMYGISVKAGTGSVAAVIVAHRDDVANGAALVARLDGLGELADFAEDADDFFGTEPLRSEQRGALPYLLPQIGVAEQACLALASSVRRVERLRLRPGTFQASQMTAMQVTPPGAVWDVAYRGPLPDPRAALLRLGSRRRRTRTKRAAPDSRAQPRAGPPASAYGAFPEPLIWFGAPPFPSTKDKILERPWLPTHRQRLLFRAPVGEIETFIYDNSLIVAASGDRRKARRTVNQVFAVLSRSGVQSTAVSDFELLEVTQFDGESGDFKGSGGAVTPRNRLLGIPGTDSRGQISLRLPEETMEPLLALADQCSRDGDQAAASLRLLSAGTLFRRESYTEAFVTAWSLIETSIARDFKAFWVNQGRSKSSIRQLDWSASQQIDLLLAVGILERRLGKRIHALRKRRNHIVHELVDATREETLRCIDVAAGRTPLPAFARKLEAQVVLL